MKKIGHSKIVEWRGWFDAIFEELNYLHDIRTIYLGMVRIINLNTNTFSGIFFRQWLQQGYGTCASLLIRRLIDKDNKTFSLYLLLEDIRTYRSAISRKRFIQMITGSPVEMCPSNGGKPSLLKNINETLADREFTESVGEANFLPEGVVDKDMEEIKDVSREIKNYVDKYLAHNDKTKIIKLPYFSEQNRPAIFC